MEITAVNFVLLSLAESSIAFYLFPHIFPTRTLTFFILVFSAVNLFVFAIYRVVVFPLFLDPLRHLPTASGPLPLFGHAYLMFKSPAGEAERKIMMTTPNTGIVRTHGIFHKSRLLITTPEAIADVLVHRTYDFEKPPWTRSFLRKFLGDGLIITEGDAHRHDRKNIMPAFHFRHIKGLYPVFWSKSMEFCNAIRTTLVDHVSDPLDIGRYATRVTLDIIGLAGLGRDIGALRDSGDELITNYEEIMEPTRETIAYFLLHLIFPPGLISAIPWKVNDRVRITTGNLRRICKEYVADKKSKMKRGSTEAEEGRDILSIMVQSNNFSDDNLADQLLTFLAAG